MKDELLPYYENELSFIRKQGKEYAAAWGKVADRLSLTADRSEDPHVERLIQSFALLTSRVHHKIDDELPEVTESLINVLCPHYLRPVPSMSVVRFQLDPAHRNTSLKIPRQTALHSHPAAGRSASCSFRTCYDVALWPLSITSAGIFPASSMDGGTSAKDSPGVISIAMECTGGTRFADLPFESLRFYLNGESSVTYALYELLFNNVSRIELRGMGATATVELPQDSINPVGFARDEGILPYPDRSFLGYRLLQEYFSFPQKYLFFDLRGFTPFVRSHLGNKCEIRFYLRAFEPDERLRHLERNIGRDVFQLGCTPIVNLFERMAEPVRISHTATEYRVVPDVHRQSATEVYSVDRVTSTVPYLETPKRYEPFYSMRHAFGESPNDAYWYSSRRPSGRKNDTGTEIYLSLVDPGFKPAMPATESLSVQVTCTNRDLAAELPFPGEAGDLQSEFGPIVSVQCLVPPTKTIRPPLRRGLQWRLISHLSLNYLSLVEGGPEALQEVLKLYDFADDPAGQRQIQGIAGLSGESGLSSVVSHHGIAFARGLRIEMELEESAFLGGGMFLFATVLERFLALYTSVNSFTQLTVKTGQRKGVLKKWPPRSGEQILL